MNRKGQTLIAFVLIIPLLLIIGAFITDNSWMAYKKNELENISKEAINLALKNDDIDKKELLNYYHKNGIDLVDLEINKGERIGLKAKYEIESFFGKIISIEKYDIEVNIQGYKKGNKIIFENR